MFEGGRGSGKGEFDSPAAMAVDPSGNFLVADTGNGRIEKFSPNGTFVTRIGQLKRPMGSQLITRATFTFGDSSKHRVQKLGPDGLSSLSGHLDYTGTKDCHWP